MDGSIIKFDLTVKALTERKFIKSLDEVNTTAGKYGLVITPEIAMQIAKAREQTLRDSGRFEIRTDTSVRFVKAFCTSGYITQEHLAQTIEELMELFYFIKNETENRVTDDELIAEMLKVYDDTCFGVMEMMQGRGLEKILRKFIWGDNDYWSEYEKEDLKPGYVDEWRE